jgi:hypothetical protein
VPVVCTRDLQIFLPIAFAFRSLFQIAFDDYSFFVSFHFVAWIESLSELKQSSKMMSLAIVATLLASSPAGIGASGPERMDLLSMKSAILETSLNIAQSLLLPNALYQAKLNLSSAYDYCEETDEEGTNTWFIQQEITSEIPPLENRKEHASPITTSRYSDRPAGDRLIPSSERKISLLISFLLERLEPIRYQDDDSESSGLECSAQIEKCSSRSRIPSNPSRPVAVGSERW